MKNLVLILLFALANTFSMAAQADSTGYSGDHFSLEGALELFKKSKSPEAFEQMLNEEKQQVNNLDLNEDGEVDYIRVIDHQEGDVHAIVLQVPVSEGESQDIAVIEIEKTGGQSAILQIIGHEDVYGEEVIAEPFEEAMKGRDKGGPDGSGYYTTRIVVNVWFWPCVSHIYRPGYTVWISPWRWRHYPRWWRPWRPVSWRLYRTRTLVWRPHFHRVNTHRVVRAHRVYTPRRTSSVTVKKRTTIVKSQTGTRRKTNTVIGKRENTVVATKNTSTRSVRKNGDRVRVDQKKKTTKVKKSTRGTKQVQKRTTLSAGKKGRKTGVKKTRKTTRKMKKNR